MNTNSLVVSEMDYYFESGDNFSETNTNNETTVFGNDIAEHVIVITLLLISIYLTTAAFLYYHRFSLAKLRLTDSLICVAACLLFLECCWFEIEIAVTQHSMIYCQTYAVVNVTLSTMMRTIIYVILWLRQRSIYGGPMQDRNSKAHIIGKVTLVGILIFGVFQIVLLSLPPQYSLPTGGCVSAPLDPTLKILIPIVFSISSAFQFVLLSLTLYPVIRQMREGPNASSKEQLKTIAVRLCICTAVCILIDMMFLIIIRRKPKNASISYIPISYAFNSVANTITTLCSFVNYKQRLWPCLKQEHAEERSPSQGNSAFSSAPKIAANNCGLE